MYVPKNSSIYTYITVENVHLNLWKILWRHSNAANFRSIAFWIKDLAKIIHRNSWKCQCYLGYMPENSRFLWNVDGNTKWEMLFSKWHVSREKFMRRNLMGIRSLWILNLTFSSNINNNKLAFSLSKFVFLLPPSLSQQLYHCNGKQ